MWRLSKTRRKEEKERQEKEKIVSNYTYFSSFLTT